MRAAGAAAKAAARRSRPASARFSRESLRPGFPHWAGRAAGRGAKLDPSRFRDPAARAPPLDQLVAEQGEDPVADEDRPGIAVPVDAGGLAAVVDRCLRSLAAASSPGLGAAGPRGGSGTASPPSCADVATALPERSARPAGRAGPRRRRPIGSGRKKKAWLRVSPSRASGSMKVSPTRAPAGAELDRGEAEPAAAGADQDRVRPDRVDPVDAVRRSPAPRRRGRRARRRGPRPPRRCFRRHRADGRRRSGCGESSCCRAAWAAADSVRAALRARRRGTRRSAR